MQANGFIIGSQTMNALQKNATFSIGMRRLVMYKSTNIDWNISEMHACQINLTEVYFLQTEIFLETKLKGLLLQFLQVRSQN
jgi:hypothetical protein